MVVSAYLWAVFSFHIRLRIKCRELVLDGNSFLWCSVGSTRTFVLLPLGQRCESAKVQRRTCVVATTNCGVLWRRSHINIMTATSPSQRWTLVFAPSPHLFSLSLSRSITCNLMQVVARCLLNALGGFWYASALNTLVAFVLWKLINILLDYLIYILPVLALSLCTSYKMQNPP